MERNPQKKNVCRLQNDSGTANTFFLLLELVTYNSYNLLLFSQVASPRAHCSKNSPSLANLQM